jgi:hypothetical protein
LPISIDNKSIIKWGGGSGGKWSKWGKVEGSGESGEVGKWGSGEVHMVWFYDGYTTSDPIIRSNPFGCICKRFVMLF